MVPLVTGLAVAVCMLPVAVFSDAETDKVLIPAGQPLIPAEAQTPVGEVVPKVPSEGVLEKSEQAAFVVESAPDAKLVLEVTAPVQVQNPPGDNAETAAVTSEASLDAEASAVNADEPGAAPDQPGNVVTASVDQVVYNPVHRDYEAGAGTQPVSMTMGGSEEATAVVGEQDSRARVPYALLLALFALIGLVPVSRRSH
jgi:hypothetical protein